jgi:hypothetical protein
MKGNARSRRRLITGFLIAAAICAAAVARTKAETPTPQLSDNRGDTVLAALESTAINTAFGLTGFFADPLTFTYPPVVVSGRVLKHPKIHNIFVDDDWDAHNPDAPTVGEINAFTQALASSHYLDQAGEYDVHHASFTGSNQRSLVCAALQPELGHAEFVELIDWVSCMAGFDPIPAPGVFPPLSGVPSPDDDTVYVVYLPRSMDIVDGGCDSLAGYHFYSAVPIVTTVDVVIPVAFSQTFAFAVIPTKCAARHNPSATRDEITRAIQAAASHEIVEAATDPLVGTGWINDAVIDDLHGNFFSEVVQVFSNINLDLKVGEVADVCEDSANPQKGPPAFQHPTQALSLLVDDPSVGGQITVAPYWSNQHNACTPFVPASTLTLGTPKFGAFVTSSTPLTITALDGTAAGDQSIGVASISYRVYPTGTTPPAFTVAPPPVQFTIPGPDGSYTVDMSATNNEGIVEALHSVTVVLDNSAPSIAIVSPEARPYTHAETLTLSFSESDGAGSGVASATASLDGATTLGGHGLASGQAINLLTELALGPHSFTVQSADHLNNAGQSSVSFTIVVTADSIKQDVNQFLAAGLIKNAGLSKSLLAKLNAAADARSRGECGTAANQYDAFIHALQAQAGKGVDANAAAIMIADAQYLIANCP